MRVLVTGGAGFIGSHLVDRYIAEGHEVTVVDDLSSGRREDVHPGARFLQMDVGDRALGEVIAAGGFDLVNHHAAQIDVRVSVSDPRKDARINVLGFLNLMEACRKVGVGRVLLASSGGVIYGETPGPPAREDDPKRPSSPYGVTKIASELYLYYYGQVHGIPGAVLRYSNVYGPRQDPRGEAGVVAIFSGRYLAGERPTVYGDGEQERDYVYVGDVVEANMRLSVSPLPLRGEKPDDLAFNVGTGVAASVNQLVRLFDRVSGNAREPIYAPPRQGELLRNYLGCARIEEVHGWKAEVTLEEGIGRTYSWFARGGDRP